MPKSNIVNLHELDKLLRSGDVYLFNFIITNKVNNYTLNIFDESFKYVCECQNLTSFDIRMIRKIYDNLYYYNDELESITQIFSSNNKNVNK